jgi:uracil-DNA glycosylase
MDRDASAFVAMAGRLPSYAGSFNPWREHDAENDAGSQGPAIRRRQLACFLGSRIGRARYCIIGEASGYQGCHFTGIPMTSERILLGGMKERGVRPEDILPCLAPERTSRPEKKPAGFSEPTATIVWDAVADNAGPLSVCVWNTVPQHLYDPSRGMLSNRNPSQAEIAEGEKTLQVFLSLFPGAKLIGMGKAAQRALEHLGVPFTGVRHPSQGGAVLFRSQIANALAGGNP